MSTAQKVLQALQTYSLKQIKSNEYQCNSPFRPGSNSHAFTVTINDEEHGAFIDFVSGDKGSLYDLAQKLNIEVPNLVQVESTKRSYADLADYAKAHGVHPDVLAKASWTLVKKDGRPALEYPTKGGTRWRFIDGQQPYYKSINGYKKCFYGLNDTLRGRLNYGADLVICNGEISTVVAQHYGLAAVCVTAGESVIPDYLMVELKEELKHHPHNQIVVALDCDDKGRKASTALVTQLRSAGYNVKAIDLGLSKGGDLADWCALRQDDVKVMSDFKTLPEIQVKQAPTPYGIPSNKILAQGENWITVKANVMYDLPPVTWLVKNLVPENELTILYGSSGSGKSFLAVDIALTVAQKHGVIYIAGEGELGYSQRIKAWCIHHQKTEGDLYMCLGAVSMINQNDVDLFIESHRQIKPRLVIVDTLARAMVGGDENSTREMNILTALCKRIMVEMNTAVLMVHHTNKQGTAERGSTVLKGASQSVLFLRDEDDVILVESVKSKDTKTPPVMYKKLLPIHIGKNDEEGNPIYAPVMIDSEKVANAAISELTSKQKKVLETIAEIFRDGGATFNELLDTTNIEKSTLYRILTRLKKEDLISQSAQREPYAITAYGIEMLGMDTDNTDNTAVSHETANTQVSSMKSREKPHTPHTTHTVKPLFEGSASDYYKNGL